MSFVLELNGAKRIPRIPIKISKVKANIPAGISLNHDEWEVLRHSNIQRHNNGLCCVAMIAPLQDACDLRAPELATDFRLDHHRPDGSEFRTAVNPTYIAPDFCMENGHAGSFYPSQAVKSWMNSPQHRVNILTPDHCYFGAGVYHTGGDSKYWVQWFVRGNDIKSIETSTGSDVFKTIYDMEEEYLVCYTKRGIKAYVPLDANCMTKDGNQYTIQLQGISYTVTVLNDKR